jgi:hypothetical protein
LNWAGDEGVGVEGAEDAAGCCLSARVLVVLQPSDRISRKNKNIAKCLIYFSLTEYKLN